MKPDGSGPILTTNHFWLVQIWIQLTRAPHSLTKSGWPKIYIPSDFWDIHRIYCKPSDSKVSALNFSMFMICPRFSMARKILKLHLLLRGRFKASAFPLFWWSGMRFLVCFWCKSFAPLKASRYEKTHIRPTSEPIFWWNVGFILQLSEFLEKDFWATVHYFGCHFTSVPDSNGSLRFDMQGVNFSFY